MSHDNSPKIVRIAITGPESTGKSELAKALANHFRTAWIPEYAREYLEKKGATYTYHEILMIARKQKELMDQVPENTNRFLFCDTELIVTYIWCKFVFGKCHPWIVREIERQKIDLYLLANIDFPWQPDPLREHPRFREKLFSMYRQELTVHKFPYEIVSGLYEKRLESAVSIIERRFG